jgi:hypothetical protein
MRTILTALGFALVAAPAFAQQYASDGGYRVCPDQQTQQGRDTVRHACGDMPAATLGSAFLASLAELEAARSQSEAYTQSVDTYAACVSDFIDAQRRPGAPAESLAPDQAACAHSWAEEQATEAVRAFGRACVDFSNRSMTDANLTPWSGACYPAVSGDNG